jgi:hypothetical protein
MKGGGMYKVNKEESIGYNYNVCVLGDSYSKELACSKHDASF